MSRAHDTEIETMGVNRVELLGSVIADDDSYIRLNGKSLGKWIEIERTKEKIK